MSILCGTGWGAVLGNKPLPTLAEGKAAASLVPAPRMEFPFAAQPGPAVAGLGFGVFADARRPLGAGPRVVSEDRQEPPW